jgi:hypothetical protein
VINATADTGNVPDDQKSVIAWGGHPFEGHFRALNFQVSDPIYYRYYAVPVGATAVAGTVLSCSDASGIGDSVYTFRAEGDLDGDTVTSLFELSVGVDRGNALYRNAEVYTAQPLE